MTPIIGDGHPFVFMEPTSPKGRDLRERGSYALHRAVPDMQGTGGEFQVSGTAWLVFTPKVSNGLAGLKVGDHIIVLSWLHRARRDVLRTYPRGDTGAHLGVFSLRSPDRPNPIGIHPVEILAISGLRILVSNLEAIDGTPVVDVKPALGPFDER